MADQVRVKLHHVSSVNFPGGVVYDFMLRMGVEAVFASVAALEARPSRWRPGTGALAKSISQERRSNQYGVNLSLHAGGPLAPYARYVHEGTQDLLIVRPGGGLMPVGKSQGRIVAYSRIVRGQEANPFLKDGLNAALARRARFGLRPVI